MLNTVILFAAIFNTCLFISMCKEKNDGRHVSPVFFLIAFLTALWWAVFYYHVT